MDLKMTLAKLRVGAGPRLKSAESIVDFNRRALEVDAAIFFGQNGRESRFRMVLREGANLAVRESLQRFYHEVGAHGG